MATLVNPERISPLTGETITNERIYYLHVQKAALRDAEKALEPTAEVTATPSSDDTFTLSHRGAGWYDIIKGEKVIDSVRGKEEAEARIETLNANSDQGNE